MMNAMMAQPTNKQWLRGSLAMCPKFLSKPKGRQMGIESVISLQERESTQDRTMAKGSMQEGEMVDLDCSKRNRRSPSHLQDFFFTTVLIQKNLLLPHYKGFFLGNPYPITNYVTCDNFSRTCRSYLKAITKVVEPRFVHEVVKEVYMNMPPGFRSPTSNKLCRLRNPFMG